MTAFVRTIGIDHLGAQTPTASLKGLRIYLANGNTPPVEVHPPPSLRKYWTRKGIAEWLVERLAEDVPTLVGIDHGFCLPLRNFEAHGLPAYWPRFLDDSSATGRPTRTTSMSSSLATTSAATVRRARAMPAGVA